MDLSDPTLSKGLKHCGEERRHPQSLLVPNLIPPSDKLAAPAAMSPSFLSVSPAVDTSPDFLLTFADVHRGECRNWQTGQT